MKHGSLTALPRFTWALPLGAAYAFMLLAIFTTEAWGFVPGDFKPGGKEFPRPNPTPTKLFIIHGTIDSALQIEFDAIYGVTNKSCMYSPLSSYIEGAGTQAPSASIPLAMQRQDAQFQIRVPIDGVLSGRCRWEFQGIIARAINEDIFRGGISATGQWVVSIGWQPFPGQPTPNPVIAKTCFVPKSTPEEAKYGVGELSCGMTIPWGTVSEQTTSVELHLSGGHWFTMPK